MGTISLNALKRRFNREPRPIKDEKMEELWDVNWRTADLIGGLRAKIFQSLSAQEQQKILADCEEIADASAAVILNELFGLNSRERVHAAWMRSMKRVRENLNVKEFSGVGGARIKDREFFQAFLSTIGAGRGIVEWVNYAILKEQRLDQYFDLFSITAPDVIMYSPLSDYLELRLVEKILNFARGASFASLPVGVDRHRNPDTVVFGSPRSVHKGTKIVLWNDTAPGKTIKAMYRAAQRAFPDNAIYSAIGSTRDRQSG